ncbi:DNA primase [Geobacter sp. DSM 9736]|uniref:DNA primase n=1 Tax=Geobacter sp. DSM 9736 TaxID=1277350 RepID=UPI000B4FE0A1|nr:DNA primase [Geobacter sp. DSM 9736]SNB47799.1 DNA primase [Geobacter sp. DSM 9736]
MIPDDKVKEVSERSSILEVVSDYVHLRRSGANYQGLCPFHGEKTPSFNVNPGRGIFHCFGCGVGGNVFSFIMKMEGLAFPEAVKFLAKRSGVVIQERPLTSSEKRRQDERETLFRISELCAQYYREVLLKDPAGEPGRRYLAKRGVDAATAESYRLGYATDRWDGLVRFLEQRHVSLEAAEKLGGIRRKSGGSGFIDLFRNRLIFTISDPHGRPIAFGARVLDDSLPKYINSPESPIYRKGDVLFGIDLAKQAMRENGSAIIVEGYFDHLALYQAGVRNAVATCGTAMTEGHVKLLQRYAGKLYTLFDSDSAGKKATFRAMELLLGENLPVSVIELPEGEDPDSFIRSEGQEAFAARMGAARPVLDFFFRHLLRQSDTGTVEGKVRVVAELAPRLEKVSDDVERALYVREIARVLGIDERLLQQKLRKGGVAPADFSVPREKRPKVDTEELLLALMGKYPEIAEKVTEYGVHRLFQPDLATVAEAVAASALTHGEVNWPDILELVGSPEERSRLASFLVKEDQLDGVNPQKMFEELCVSRERRALKEMDRLKKELVRVEPGSERYVELLREIDSLRNRKSQLL